MTLIISVATPEYVVSVADRRLSFLDGRVADDDANKVVMFCNSMVFTYTGLAHLEGVKTDVWLADALAALPDRSLAAAYDHIALRATQAMSLTEVLTGVRHAHTFAGAGFEPAPAGTELLPTLVRISNVHDGSGTRLESPSDAFTVTRVLQEGRTGVIQPNGWPLEADETESLRARCHEATQSGPYRDVDLINVIAAAVRGVSARLGNQWVGKSLLAAWLPRQSASRADVFLLGPGGVGMAAVVAREGHETAHPREPSWFFYAMPEDSADPVCYGPHLVIPGMKVMNFRAEFQPPDASSGP